MNRIYFPRVSRVLLTLLWLNGDLHVLYLELLYLYFSLTYGCVLLSISTKPSLRKIFFSRSFSRSEKYISLLQTSFPFPGVPSEQKKVSRLKNFSSPSAQQIRNSHFPSQFKFLFLSYPEKINPCSAEKFCLQVRIMLIRTH